MLVPTTSSKPLASMHHCLAPRALPLILPPLRRGGRGGRANALAIGSGSEHVELHGRSSYNADTAKERRIQSQTTPGPPFVRGGKSTGLLSPLLKLLPLLALLLVTHIAHAADPPISFNRDIRPILSEHCYRCHGPDAGARKAGLRMDRRDDAIARLKSGATAVVPGKPDESEFIARITSDDPNSRMPPEGQGKALSQAQVDTLRRWVEGGATWEAHWSLNPPRRPAVPEVKDSTSPRNPIDRFLLAGLEARNTKPSPEADRTTLVRRLYLDLIGLPPSPDEVDAFLANTAPDVYERLVDRLLASPHYGERMATGWLDLVRFADTVGYHSDVDRSITLFRDYVIKAFNDDLPFDRFTTEQLAGDLLPNATEWQRVASAYNMLGMTTEEGGAQPKEYIARHAADRVRNAGSVWMGATLACAECHDHKYDPYSTRDFYAFAAFFADLQQPGVGTPRPTLEMPTSNQRAEQARLKQRIAELEAAASSPSADKASIKERLAAAKRAEAQLEKTIRKTIIAISGPPRVTRVLHRGDWMDESGEVVQPAVPHAFKSLECAPGKRPSRLDLARWLVAPAQPQTARVVVNRLWKQFFGTGLSDTLEDLGAQGEWPTNPELLDWLAVEFREQAWSLKHIVRLMVTSTAYRQSSRPRDDLAVVDPGNRLYARQSSFRLDAEQIRDSALASGGLLVRTIGGESTRPYQPEGYWRFLNFPARTYVASTGSDQYRRGLYTHWQRTLLHPSLLAFDAPSREQCTARRPISNTPQAALALMNDPSFVEAARALAERTLREQGQRDRDRLVGIWRQVLSRTPTESEQRLVAALLEKHRRDYGADQSAAAEVVRVGQMPPNRSIDPAELAAWTSVARAILNLDEAITRD